MSFFLQIKRSPVKVKKNPYKQMTLALPKETDRQNLLAGYVIHLWCVMIQESTEFIVMKKKENIIQ